MYPNKIRKLFLFFISLTGSFHIGLSQFDYQLFDPFETYLYHDESGFYHTVKWDSIYIGNATNYLFNHKTFRETDLGFYTDQGDSWLGTAVRQVYGSGVETILLDNEEEINIKFDAQLDESFDMYYYLSGEKIVGTVISIQEEDVIGVLDSVKTIALQKKGADGTDINHYLNSTSLKVSKSFGLVQGLDFYHFPDQFPQHYILAGMESKNLGVQNLSFTDIFDLEPGDEIHEYAHSFTVNLTFNGYYIYKVLSLEFNEDETSVNIIVERCAREEEFEQNETTIRKFNDTTALYRQAYTGEDEPCFKFPGNYPDIPFNLEPRTYVKQYRDGSYNNRMIKGYGELFFKWEEENDWSILLDVVCADFYIQGLGQYFDFKDAGLVSYRHPVYYKKGSEEWGNPYHCGILTSVKAVDPLRIKVSPNPFSHEFNIRGIQEESQFRLYSMLGDVVLECKIQSGYETIQANHLPNGVYIYSIETNGQTITGSLIKNDSF